MIDMVKIGDHKSWIFTDSAPPTPYHRGWDMNIF